MDDRNDYKEFLNEIGQSEAQVRSVVENLSDMTDLPEGLYKIRLAPSPIEGMGLFPTADIEAGEIIAPARISGMRTIAGRFTNHSASPNAEMVRGDGHDINLRAIKSISGQEITVNYRQAGAANLSTRQALLADKRLMARLKN